MQKSIASILCVLSFVAFAAPTVSYQTATNIAKRVVDQALGDALDGKLDRIVRDPLFEHNHSEFKQTLDGLDYTTYQTDGGETEVLDIAHIGNKMVYVTEGSNWFTSGFHASEDYRGFGISQSSSDFKNGNFSTFYGDGFIDCGGNEITIPNATGTMALMSTTLAGYGITDGATKTELAAAVSTNNPAFVSAVQNTPAPEPGQGEDPPWGTWGTVGAAIAGLVAGLKWLKDKVFDSAGNIQDQFATDLLGKQVANAKVRYALSTTSSATMDDRTVNIYTLSSGTVAMVFPTATTHDGKTYARDFLLKLTYSGGTLQMPTGVTKVGDELSFEAGKTYLIAFTEIAADKFYVRSIDITEAQA